ncbi:MAG TPA: GNVR domain-containing protein [Longimicrobium sp.]|nr:GNVR domain-containing protein [Longimicrobium sp.]
MNQAPIPPHGLAPLDPRPGASPNGGEPEVRLLDLSAVLLRSWKLVAASALLAAAVAAAMALLTPRSWTSAVVVVPSASQGDSRAQLIAAQLKLPMVGGLAGGGPNQSLVEAILRSNTLKDSVIGRVSPHAGRAEHRRLRRILERTTAIRSNPSDRSVAVEVTANDPRLAARLAGQFPDVINEIATRLSVQTAVRKRDALERQLVDARNRLVRSEEQLRTYEKATGTGAVEEQARRSVDAAAELQRGIIQQELVVSELRRSATPGNPRLRAAEGELAARRGQLARLNAGGGRGDVFLGARELPDVKLDYSRLYREFTKDEQVYMALTASLASAQVDTNDDLALVSVLDAAAVPEVPSAPRKKLMVVVGLLFGTLAGMVLAFAREFVRRARSDPASEPFFDAWSGFTGDLRRVVPGSRRTRTPTH